MSGQKEAIIQKYSPVIIYITISKVILNIQQFRLTKIKNIWKEMIFFLWGDNDAGHTDGKGWKCKGGNERNEAIAVQNGTTAKANTDVKKSCHLLLQRWNAAPALSCGMQ